MLRCLLMVATLMVLGTGTGNAQQREAVFRKIEVPNSGFDIILVTAKVGSPAPYYQDHPDPSVIYLPGGLVAAYTPDLAGGCPELC